MEWAALMFSEISPSSTLQHATALPPSLQPIPAIRVKTGSSAEKGSFKVSCWNVETSVSLKKLLFSTYAQTLLCEKKFQREWGWPSVFSQMLSIYKTAAAVLKLPDSLGPKADKYAILQKMLTISRSHNMPKLICSILFEKKSVHLAEWICA